MVGSVFFRGIIFGAALIAPFSLFGMEDKNIITRTVKLRPIGPSQTVTKEMIVSNKKIFKFKPNVGDKAQLCQEFRPGTATPSDPCYFNKALFKNNRFVAKGKNGSTTFIMLEREETHIDEKKQRAELIKALKQPIPTAQRLRYKHTGTGCSECSASTTSATSTVPTTTTTVVIPPVEGVGSEESGDVVTSGGSGASPEEKGVVVVDKKEDTQEKVVQSNDQDQNDNKKPEIKANTSWLRFFTMRRMLMVGAGVTVLVYLNWNYLKTLIKR